MRERGGLPFGARPANPLRACARTTCVLELSMESFPALERDRVAEAEALLLARLAAGEHEQPLAEL
jgi:hypothetical protein